MIDLSNFDWGWMDRPPVANTITSLGEYHKTQMIEEIFESRGYEKIFQIKEGDVVVDIGASVGPFTYSILNKNPKRVYCLEPSNDEFKTITKNLSNNPNVTLINKG